MSDCINRQATLKAICGILTYGQALECARRIKALPSAQPETCEGCRHLGKWEKDDEYGYLTPCTCCKRRGVDHYER